MAHLADSEIHSAEWGPKALRATAHTAQRVVYKLVANAAEIAPHLKSALLGVTDHEAMQFSDAFRPDVAEHLRKILETGYIEEETGTRVHVPAYIRSQLISELRLLS